MPYYSYRAQNQKGKAFTGKLNADSEQDLHDKLKDDGSYLIDCKEIVTTKTFRPLKKKELSEYSRQVGTLLGSGVSLVRALRIITQDESITDSEREIYKQVQDFVLQGIPLSDAMEKMGGVFPPLLINMYRAAEASGSLDKTALRMADQYQKEDHLNKKINSALTYPKILAVLVVVVVIIIMAYVIPQFQDLFDQMESMPVATVILLAISNFVQHYWYVLIVAAVLIYLAIHFIFKIPKVRYGWDWFKVHVWIFGKLNKVIYTAHFSRTLSSLYSSGIPIVTSLEIAKNTIGNSYIENQFVQVITDIKAGLTLSSSLEKVDGFIKKLPAAIKVGEETGSLDSMLNSTADDLDYDSEMAVTKMTMYIEPIMIVIMAVIVCFVMIAVIQPIYQSYQYIGAS